MISDDSLITYMKDSLTKIYIRMEKSKTDEELNRTIKSAPAFIFKKTFDFLEASKSDFIVVLVPPDKFYKFEILNFDYEKNKIFVDSINFKRITENKFSEIIMDYYPMLASL